MDNVDRVLRTQQVGLARPGRSAANVHAPDRTLAAQDGSAPSPVDRVGVVTNFESHHVR